jgi:hypothetical protein
MSPSLLAYGDAINDRQATRFSVFMFQLMTVLVFSEVLAGPFRK